MKNGHSLHFTFALDILQARIFFPWRSLSALISLRLDQFPISDNKLFWSFTSPILALIKQTLIALCNKQILGTHYQR